VSDDLKTRLKHLIIEELRLPDVQPAGIKDAAPLFGDGLGLDSLDALQLAVAIEERFGVRIGDEAAGKQAFASVEALAGYIEAQRGAAAP
jgi:acyl carrier protein